MAASLQSAREQIDTIDRRLVDLLAQRQAVVDEISALKDASGRAVRDPEREAQLLARLRDHAERTGLAPDLVEAIYACVLDHSKARQRAHRERTDSLAA
jgi:chorismate mutase-like protein